LEAAIVGDGSPTRHSLASALLDGPDATLVELVDNLLDKGVVLDAELVLGLAGVDLVYVRLAALLCAADRIVANANPVSRGR
jgi:hypothetical protein